MTRIIVPLGLLAMVMMLASMALGLALGDLGKATEEYIANQSEIRVLQTRFAPDRDARLAELAERQEEIRGTLQWANLHRLLGLASALAVVLVNSIVVTYFIGTSRWCKEVVQAYRLDPAPARHSAELKRKAFAWAVAGMLTVLAIAALGAAGDPIVSVERHAVWSTWHLAAAMAGICVIGWGLYVQWSVVAENHQSIQQIMDQVQTIRGRQGLEVEAN
jgi:hypothetical protein